MRKYLRLYRLPRKRRRRAMLRLASRIATEDQGGEVLEYAVVAGLIVVAAIGIISCVGTKIVGKWQNLNAKI